MPGKTLLFFDEVQACPAAISSLRFFYEKTPDLHVVAAGSLLEYARLSLPSYGVGRVRSLPVEVKSSGKGTMQSLRQFLKEKGKPYGYRFSLENSSAYSDIKSYPLYAVSNLVLPITQDVDQ